MNEVILIGRLTKDVELKYTQSNNTSVASFTLAVNRKYVKTGEERGTDFFNVVVWSKLAETASRYLKKGMQTAISGRLETRNWQDEQGQKHYITEVIAENIDFIDHKAKEGTDKSTLYKNNNTEEELTQVSKNGEKEGDDLPF